MTPGAKARKHKQWLLDRKVDEDFHGRTLGVLMDRFRLEQKGVILNERTEEHELAYLRLMKFMKSIVAGTQWTRRVDAYRMVLKRVWERKPLRVGFDDQLFDELDEICQRLWSIILIDAGPGQRGQKLDVKFQVKFDRILTPRFTRETANLNKDVFDMDIRELLTENVLNDAMTKPVTVSHMSQNWTCQVTP